MGWLSNLTQLEVNTGCCLHLFISYTANVGLDLRSSVSKDKRVKTECPLSLHLADLFISERDYIIFRMCSVSLRPGFFPLYHEWLTYNLSLRKSQHLNSQKSYYSSATPACFSSIHHYFDRKSLHWSDLSTASRIRLALQVAALVQQTSGRLPDTWDCSSFHSSFRTANRKVFLFCVSP